MKIEFAVDTIKPVRFTDIEAGTCVKDEDGVICLVCEDRFVVNLTTGETWEYADGDEVFVIPLNAKIVIE